MAGLRDCINEIQVYSINFYGFSSTINVSEFFFIHECGICYALKKTTISLCDCSCSDFKMRSREKRKIK